MTSSTYDLLVIGAGVSGYGASLYAGRFKLNTLVIGKDTGGVINWASDVDNYPGVPEVSGIDLADKIKDHAFKFGAELKQESVENLEAIDGLYKVTTEKDVYYAKCLIIATGSERKRLGIPGEKKLEGNGVHSCAICDGFLYKNKEVAVVGGSDSAVKEALVLSEYASKVYVIYRGEQIRAEPIIYEKALNTSNIEFILNTNVKELKGSSRLESALLDNKYKDNDELKLDGLFIEVGHSPLSQLARKIGVDLNDKGEIITDKMSRTNVDGVFAAGDVTDIDFKQAITGVAQGVTAAYMAFKLVRTKSS
ncbi:MAG: NAD(P)/FAD-dependent oxidoreductase [Nanobdellota archaeon]